MGSYPNKYLNVCEKLEFLNKQQKQDNPKSLCFTLCFTDTFYCQAIYM